MQHKKVCIFNSATIASQGYHEILPCCLSHLLLFMSQTEKRRKKPRPWECSPRMCHETLASSHSSGETPSEHKHNLSKKCSDMALLSWWGSDLFELITIYHFNTHTHIYIYKSIYIYKCIYIYIYMYVCIYIYTYIYIVIHRYTISLYHNSSMWLDLLDTSNWDRKQICQLDILPLSQQHSQCKWKYFLHISFYVYIISYLESSILAKRYCISAYMGPGKYPHYSAQPTGWGSICELQTVFPGIWTCVNMSVSYDNHDYIMSASNI